MEKQEPEISKNEATSYGTLASSYHRSSDFADKIVASIIYDLSDRRGIGDEWGYIDDEIKEEIVEKWKDIILRYAN